jgi:DNA-binding Lrp family transcriptional regulator
LELEILVWFMRISAGIAALKLDSLDLKIISALQKDGRMAFTDIAKMFEVPTATVQTRYNKMKKDGLIIGSTIMLDMEKIGQVFFASIGIRALESEIQQVINYIRGLKLGEASLYTWITFGRFNIAAVINSTNLLEVHRIKQLIKEHPSVIEVSISLARNFDYNFEALNLQKLLEE